MAALLLRYELKVKARTVHVPTFLGWFWVRVPNVAHVRPWSKNGAKNQNLHLRR